MADFIFNVAKGRLNEFANRVNSNDPSGSVLRVRLYKVFSGSQDDYDNCTSLGTSTTGVEDIATTTIADFTNYADKTLTDSDVGALTQNDTAETLSFDISDIVWSSAGGASNNTLAKLVIYYDSTGSDGDACIPLAAYDFVITTNGSDLQATINASGLWTAS